VVLLLVAGCGSNPGTLKAADARALQVEQLLRSGRALGLAHQPKDAEPPLRKAIALAWGFGPPWSKLRARGLSELARTLLAEGRGAEARAAVEQALALLEPGALDDDQRISELETTRGESLRDGQQLGAAVTPFTAAVQATERHPAQLAPALVAISLRLAETLEALGRRQHAKQVLERALFVAKQPAVGAELAGRLNSALAAFSETRAVNQPLLAAAGANTAKQVVAMQSDFRACYQASLAEQRDVAGRVALVISIAADGHVSNVKTDGTGLPISIVDCLVRRASVARFEPPKGGSAVITVPVTFVQQEND
jgi:tetratricopeptide (TPR) repeat protein